MQAKMILHRRKRCQLIRSISTVIDEKNGNVSCGVAVTLQESGKIEITMKLQRKTSTGWKTLETWNSSKTGIKFNYSETNVIFFYRYKLYNYIL